jgi:folate-dependent phosphoribosylglycinamide formyltransferase PurN
MKRRVAILISGRGSNMAALIRAAGAEDFPAEIALVISNRADAPGRKKPEPAAFRRSSSKANHSARTAPRSRRRCKRCWTATESS